eukprot:2781042-Pyramimonas_sp.AAC.1
MPSSPPARTSSAPPWSSPPTGPSSRGRGSSRSSSWSDAMLPWSQSSPSSAAAGRAAVARL